MSLQPRRIDLHVHGPASHDFHGSETYEQLLDMAISKGMDAIALTDHNSVDGVDDINLASKNKNIAVFPGMEISCGGAGKGPIHVLGIFDVGTTKDELQKVLGKLDVNGKGEQALSSKSVFDVINIIRENKGLPILAHANSTHGALSDIIGNPRIEIVKNPNLIAVHATESDFRKPVGKRLVDILNGQDPAYKTKLAVIKASDNPSPSGGGHAVSTIGDAFSYFKMGELSLEGLRQCFEDPDTRIIQNHEASDKILNYAHIQQIKVDGGFLKGLQVDFHPGMNSIIGGTGTGKSLTIEFLRFAFGKKPEQSLQLMKDHKDKLKHRLGANGVVKVRFQDSSGEVYELERQYDASLTDPYDSPIKCVNLTKGVAFEGNLDGIFPLLFYSQSEIVDISRNNLAQLGLLDNFRDFKKYKDREAVVIDKIATHDNELITSFQRMGELPKLRRELKTVTANLEKAEAKIKQSLPKGTSDEYLRLSQELEEAEAALEGYDALSSSLEETERKLIDNQPESPASASSLGEVVTGGVVGAYQKTAVQLRKQVLEIQVEKKKSEKKIRAWLKANKFTGVKKAYDKQSIVEERKQGLEQDRQKLAGEKRRLDSAVNIAEKASNRFDEYRDKRRELLAELEQVFADYSKERAEQCALVTDRSAGSLRIALHVANNKDVYRKRLMTLKAGSYLEETEVDSLVAKLSPVALVDLILSKDTKELARRGGIGENKAENFIKELLSPANIRNTLSLQYQTYPEDRIEINYQKKDGKYYPLEQLSMGQKSDALIMIALGDSSIPVIVDQPEDALDISSIWKNICTKLRITKHARQFIFTTHNSSVAVASDSDQFIILKADGEKGWVHEVGTIEEIKVKSELVEHLEGGEDSYGLKRRKYDL